MKQEEKEKAINHLKEVIEYVYGSKKNLEPSKRKIVFMVAHDSLAYKNFLKLFQEEVLRQRNDLKTRE